MLNFVGWRHNKFRQCCFACLNVCGKNRLEIIGCLLVSFKSLILGPVRVSIVQGSACVGDGVDNTSLRACCRRRAGRCHGAETPSCSDAAEEPATHRTNHRRRRVRGTSVANTVRCVFKLTTVEVHKLKGVCSCSWKHFSELRSVTCHMGSHCVTRHPT